MAKGAAIYNVWSIDRRLYRSAVGSKRRCLFLKAFKLILKQFASEIDAQNLQELALATNWSLQVRP